MNKYRFKINRKEDAAPTEEETKKKEEEEAAAKKKEEEEAAAAEAAKKKEEEEAAAAKKKQEEEAAEAAKKKQEDEEAAAAEAAKKKEEEEAAAAKKKQEEEEAAAAEAKKKQEEEAAAKIKEEEEAAAKRKQEEEEEEEAKRKEEEAKKEELPAESEEEILERKKRAAARNNKIRELQKQFEGKKSQLELFTSNDQVIAKPHLIMENQENIPDDYSRLEATKECELKQGFLGLVTDIQNPTMRDQNGKEEVSQFPVLQAKAVFAVLNKNSLSLFDRENVNSLIKTIDVAHLQPSYVSNKFDGLNCFQLIAGSQVMYQQYTISRGVDYLKDNVLATLCAVNVERMTEWTEAIKTFHNCKVEIAQDETVTQKSNVDVLKERSRILRRRIVDDEKTNKEYNNEEDNNEVLMVKRFMDEVKKEVVKEKSRQSIERRKQTIKLQHDIEESREVENEQNCIQQMQNLKSEEEEKQVEDIIRAESETREQRELEIKKKKIIDAIKKQGGNIKLEEEGLDAAIQRMTRDMQYTMVQSVQSYENIKDPQMCYFNDYSFPTDIKTLSDRRKYVCTQMIDPQVIDIDTINSCMIADFFCDVCCNNNIGPGQEVQREECVQKCSAGLVAGDSNEFSISYVLQMNNKKFDKEKEAMKKKYEEEQKKKMEEYQKKAKNTQF